MQWNNLEHPSQLHELIDKSRSVPQVIFKHSTRCSISSVVKNRLERAGVPANIEFNYLDLISFRNVSNMVADHFGVHHESPQLLLIRDGKCVYDESHNGIDMEELKEQLSQS